MNKILIITPTPTHPTNAGNRAAIVALVQELKEAGKEVHCLYIPFENYGTAEMSQFFDGNFYTFERALLHSRKPVLVYYRKRIIQKLNNFWESLMTKLGKKRSDFELYNKKIDEGLSYHIKKFTREIARDNQFDVVICEYVWLSGLLKYFPHKTFKIIDTHDRFSNRYLVYKKLNKVPEWNSFSPAEEAKGLKRGDLILALNLEEKKYFEKISGRETIIRLPVVSNMGLKKNMFNNTLLYFASDNIINVTSLQMFIDTIFPLITEEVSSTKLLIGGSICTKLNHVPTNVELCGSFSDPADFYILGDIVINPEIEGTGFKIKTFEAMGYGMPIVSTRAGAAGLSEITNEHLIIAETKEEFANGVLCLLKDSALREKLALNSRNWVQTTRRNLRYELFSYLEPN